MKQYKFNPKTPIETKYDHGKHIHDFPVTDSLENPKTWWCYPTGYQVTAEEHHQVI